MRIRFSRAEEHLSTYPMISSVMTLHGDDDQQGSPRGTRLNLLETDLLVRDRLNHTTGNDISERFAKFHR